MPGSHGTRRPATCRCRPHPVCEVLSRIVPRIIYISTPKGGVGRPASTVNNAQAMGGV